MNNTTLPGEPHEAGNILTEYWLNDLLKRIQALEAEVAALKAAKK
jgi:hypothetical protein